MSAFAISIENSFHRRKDSNSFLSSSWSNSFPAQQTWLREITEHAAYEEEDRLDSKFCKDFNCCGKTLTDLHDLLSHYEECHVTPNGLDSVLENESDPKSDLIDLKKHAKACMSFVLDKDSSMDDLANPFVTTKDISIKDVNNVNFYYEFPQMVGPDDMIESTILLGPPSSAEDWVSAQDTPSLWKSNSKYEKSSSNGFSDDSSVLTIDSPASNLVVVDKPFKCPIMGCDKAYKNQNGLKYHKIHGHCESNGFQETEDDDQSQSYSSAPASPVVTSITPTPATSVNSSFSGMTAPVFESKPYRCELCGKRYKNLNGLKYHRTHSHQQISMAQAQREIQMSCAWGC